MRSSVRRPLLLVGLILGISAAPAPGLPLGIRILAPEDVLAERTRTDAAGALCLVDEWGMLRPFVTSPTDPLIANPGDGAFHPVALDAALAALEGADVRFTSRLAFETYLLPYPVVSPLTSWADGRAIYLSPGVRKLSDRQIHYLVSHELGHLIHRTYLPDEDVAGWAEYREIRGIQDTARFHEDAVHRDRPHEIFAEDFRYFFGARIESVPDAIENSDLPAPDRIPGLRDYFLRLIGAPVEATMAAAIAYPNPCRDCGTLRFRLTPSVEATAIELFDVTGRSVRRFEPLRPEADGTISLDWGGLGAQDRTLPAGVYFCRIEAGTATRTVSVRLLP